MKSFTKRIKSLLRDEEGATAVEYGIMVGAIAAIIITLVLSIGGKTNNAFNATDTNMSSAPFTS